MERKVRVRFAPSPTGGLHIGGVRTVLFNYLFAHKHHGEFILRIEDTDQGRFVQGAEEYIYETLAWCGLQPNESPMHGGQFAPYRQSERKSIYREYAEKLIEEGKAYYAFDTPGELVEMREKNKSAENPTPQYDHKMRDKMKNSLVLNQDETNHLLRENTPYVVRIKMPENEEIIFNDMIRGEVSFHSSQVDDKVLLKADGMPTYHLAVVVDDYLMQITHAFRGEEWLPSAPVHIMLWKYFGWINEMPEWAHLPLILKPDGHGKLSKRDGARLGFPVFAMNWLNPANNELQSGFRETGFLPEALINMLAMLGWNDGSDQEIFSLNELIEKFSIDHVHKAGAKFDYEKAKWYNHEWIKRSSSNSLLPHVKYFLGDEVNGVNDEKITFIIDMVKERCTLLSDFKLQAGFFFKSPETIDTASIKKWDEKKQLFFLQLIQAYELLPRWEREDLETTFKEIAAAQQIKTGELMLPLRIMLVGGKFGPGVFNIAEIIGKEETKKRIEHTLSLLTT